LGSGLGGDTRLSPWDTISLKSPRQSHGVGDSVARCRSNAYESCCLETSGCP